MAKKSSKNSNFSRVALWLVLYCFAALIIFNLLFLLHTSSELGVLDPDRQNNAPLSVQNPVNLPNGKAASRSGQKYVEIEVFSSKTNVTLTINGKVRFDKSEMLLRGLNVVVLNEVSGAVMSSVWFDTYEDSDDSQRLMDFLQGLRKGRILCFAVKDEAIGSLSQSARDFLASLGSAYMKQLKFRSMWAFVMQQMEDHIVVYAESFQNPESGGGGWGQPVTIRTWVTLLPENVQTCRWDDSVENRRRIEFCEKFEGYGDVCNCENPSSLSFDPPALPDGSRVALPVAVMAGNRPHYLLRMLRSLRDVHGLEPSMVTVYIDGFYEEPLSVTRMFGIAVEQHAGASRLNSRICQHYKKSLTASFDRFPNANYLVILEEDLEMSSDILSYFNQLLPVLEKDESVYCISAWNDQGYDHLANDPAMMYRIETMPGLGWVLSRKLYKGELEAKWPKPDQMWDWDIWMRGAANRKGRECIIPDISRTYHFGAKGLNVGGFMQTIYFQKHALNKVPNVKMDAEKMYKDNYEKEITRLLSSAEVLDHTKTPCANLRDFVPDTVGKLYVFYIRMDGAQDYTTWNNVARCFRMWDLDVRGFHNSMWRFWIKKNHILVVGCPASVYCALKPDNVSPIYLPNKETRPRDDVK